MSRSFGFKVAVTLVVGALAGPVSSQATVHPLLVERMAQAVAGEQLEAYLVMDDQMTLAELENHTIGLSSRERRVVVADLLKSHAALSQASVQAVLEAAALAGRAEIRHTLWAGNAIVFAADSDVLEQLATLDGVDRIRPVVNLDAAEYQDVAPAPMLASASYPFFEDFESGVLGSAWTVETTGTGVVDVTSDQSPEGNFHVTMASSLDSSEGTATLTVSLDLVGQSDVGLRFLFKEFGDEDDPEDAVLLSDDGGNSWFEALSLTSGSTNYATRTLQLDDAIANLGLSYTNDFRIRFSWSDNFTIPTDGFAFDNIEIAPGVGEPVPELNIVKLQAPELWNIGVTGDGITIANIDSGTDTTHPDLANRLWTNPGEIPGNGIDDDSNGKIDDIVGWDFVDNEGNPDSFDPHGTQTAGLMVGDGTSGLMTGMAPGARIAAMRIGGETDYWAAQQYALEIGVDVVSSSFSFKWPFAPKPDYAMHRQLCNVELAAGIIHANSIGNQGNLTASGYPVPWNISAPGNCPQPWGHPDAVAGGRSSVLGCAGIQIDDTLYTSSGQGPAAWEDVTLYDAAYPHAQNSAWFDYPMGGFGGAGPGLLKPDVCTYTNTVITTTIGGGYSSFGGTSAATPQLGGGLALLRDHQPNALPRHIAAAVELASVDLGPVGKDTRYGAGKLAVFDSARRLLIVGAADDLTPSIGATFTLDIFAEPGSNVFAFYGPTLDAGPSDFNLGGTFFLLNSVTMDGAGMGSLSLTIPSIPALVDALVHFQFGSANSDVLTWGPGPRLSVPETIQITN